VQQTRMHDTFAAGGYPLDSSAAGGTQLEPTPSEPHGRRTARRLVPAWTWTTPPSPGQLYRARRRMAGETDNAVDGQRRRPARSPAWPRVRARAGMCGESAITQRYLHVLEQRLTYIQAADPWPPRQARGQLDCGHRRAAPRPAGCATANRNPPVAQLGRGRDPGSTQGSCVITAVGGPRPAPAQRRPGSHRSPSRGGQRLANGCPTRAGLAVGLAGPRPSGTATKISQRLLISHFA
jgi:hypothetical protein